MVKWLTGKSVFDGGHYRESELTRLANLFAHASLEAWRGFRILEVGAGPGRIGDAFQALGFQVVSTDGRAEHVERLRARGRDAFVLDLDAIPSGAMQGFDLIVAFGVLYHLTNPQAFLSACGSARVLLLESAVCDSHLPILRMVREARGWRGKDQALQGLGCRPSPSWIETACQSAGFDLIRDISSPLANWSIGYFNWKPESNGEWTRGGRNLRKMWICEKTSA